MTANTKHPKIDALVKGSEVVLFMKGDRNFPQCGFSATVIQILNSTGAEYSTVNVLSDPEIRQGIKEYSSWPTIPQLYVKGEFIGGCDIVRDMDASGELHNALGIVREAVEPPTINLTDRAVETLRGALADGDDGDHVHLSINAQFEHSLSLGPKTGSEVATEANGIVLLVDFGSAKKAQGVIIDFVDGPGGAGFKIDNPNAPAVVAQLSPTELKAKLDAGEIKELFDVRTEEERSLAKIEGARLLDDTAIAYIGSLAPETPIAFHCHHGGRSASAAEHFRSQGFKRVYNLAGGIDAWAQQVDKSLARY